VHGVAIDWWEERRGCPCSWLWINRLPVRLPDAFVFQISAALEREKTGESVGWISITNEFTTGMTGYESQTRGEAEKRRWPIVPDGGRFFRCKPDIYSAPC
jgi:hypothetical protein